jgi:uncharacterized protein
MERLLLWRGLDESLAEAAVVRLEGRRMRAEGTQLGFDPRPYRVDYELTTGDDWVTERLLVTARDDMGTRRLDLSHDGAGAWTGNGEPLPELEGALDCDLAHSPVTNAMPVLREGLLDGGEPVDFSMAWVGLPGLDVHRSPQRYEPIDARTVRYVSRDSDFRADLELDEHGLVLRYPQMAERVQVLSSDAA